LKDSSGACSGSKFVVSKVEEEYDAHLRGLNGEFQLDSAGKGKTMLRTMPKSRPEAVIRTAVAIGVALLAIGLMLPWIIGELIR